MGSSNNAQSTGSGTRGHGRGSGRNSNIPTHSSTRATRSHSKVKASTTVEVPLIAVEMTPDSDVDTDSSTPDTTMPEPRYQLRARTPSAASSATSSDETDADGEKILRKSVSKKSGLRRPLGQKPSSGKLSSAGHTDPSPCYVNFHEEPPTLTADTSASNFNPIFLRMSCWRDENPDTEPSSPLTQAPDTSITFDETLREISSPLLTPPPEASHPPPIGGTPSHRYTDASLFKYAPSKPESFLRSKRLRSNSEPIAKIACKDPRQSIHGQLTHTKEGGKLASQFEPTTEPVHRLTEGLSVAPSSLMPLLPLEPKSMGPSLADPSMHNSLPKTTTYLDLDVAMEDDDATPRPLRRGLPPFPLTCTNVNIPHAKYEANADDSSEPSTYPPDSDNLSIGDWESNSPIAMSEDHGDETTKHLEAQATSMPDLVGLDCIVVPLMEHSHPELITSVVRERIFAIDTQMEARWENPDCPLSGSDTRYMLAAFRHMQIPPILFSRDGPSGLGHHRWKATGHSSRTSHTYLIICVYFHLLGLRAAASMRTGQWDIREQPPSCSLAAFSLQLGAPQLLHNRCAREIFTNHFIRATHAKLYSAVCIGGTLFNEKKIGQAFDHALRVQVQLQLDAKKDKPSCVMHQHQRRNAMKIAKWLLLHQAVNIAENQRVAALIATSGPELCSSDESSSDGESDEPRDDTQSTSMVSWRSAEMMACISTLREEGLYYRGVVRHSTTLTKPPPDGTPISWISSSYLDHTPS